MKTYQIQSERQKNGIWGSPPNLVFVKHIPSKDLLFSAIIIVLAEKYPQSSIIVDMMFDEWFSLKINNVSEEFRSVYHYKKFYVDDNDIIDNVPETTLMKLFEQFGGEYKIVSIKEYLKLNNLMDAPKSELIQHLQSPLNKKNIKDRFPGWKPKKLKYQLPGEPEIMAKRRLPYLYQEKKKPE